MTHFYARRATTPIKIQSIVLELPIFVQIIVLYSQCLEMRQRKKRSVRQRLDLVIKQGPETVELLW